MTQEEAKTKIKSEFIDRYYHWLDDYVNMNDHDYGWKYGWQKRKDIESYPDNLSSVMLFQKYMWNGRWMKDWNKVGFDKNIIWDLAREKWLSEKLYWNSNARATGCDAFYFISQARAKEIWKELKR